MLWKLSDLDIEEVKKNRVDVLVWGTIKQRGPEWIVAWWYKGWVSYTNTMDGEASIVDVIGDHIYLLPLGGPRL